MLAGQILRRSVREGERDGEDSFSTGPTTPNPPAKLANATSVPAEVPSMTWLHRVGIVAFLASLAAVVVAQDRPNFTGTWTRLQPPLSPEESSLQTVTQTGSQITLQVQSSGSAGPMGYAYHGDRHTYTIGGPAELKKNTDGSLRSVAVSWDGPRLVFVRTTTEGANVTTERESWSLSADGRELTKDTETTSWRGTSRGRTVLQRAAAKGKQKAGERTSPAGEGCPWRPAASGPVQD
jgi:hypothetical protein